MFLENTATTPDQAYVASNIFWENHDQTLARNGFAIFSQNVNKVTLQNNMFYGNGASDTDQSGATNDLGNGFSPALLGTTAAAAESNLGNFVGNPAFVFPIDPRPGSDGPANFYIDANFQLTSISAAIDNAWEATAIPTDFLGNTQVYDQRRLRSARIRPARHGGLRVRRHRRPGDRRQLPGRHHVARARRRGDLRRRRDRTVTVLTQRDHRRPSREMSIPPTSRRPTWSCPGRPSTRLLPCMPPA